MAVLSASELAAELDTDSRTVRKFLRSVTPKDAQPGKGSRWGIEKKQVRSLRSQFVKFQAAQAEKAAQDATQTPEDDAPAVIEVSHTGNATSTH
jgi:hypothetical protein